MAKAIVIRIKLAWWVPIYLKTLSLFCWTFGTVADPDKVALMVRKGITIYANQRRYKYKKP